MIPRLLGTAFITVRCDWMGWKGKGTCLIPSSLPVSPRSPCSGPYVGRPADPSVPPAGGEIPEGYLKVTLPDGNDKEILHPAYPGSVYHATKVRPSVLSCPLLLTRDPLVIGLVWSGSLWLRDSMHSKPVCPSYVC